MKLHRTTAAAYKLLRDGAVALARVEAAGIRVDKGYLDKAILKVQKSIDGMTKEMHSDKEVFPAWKKRYGRKLKLSSRTQLADVLFDVLGQKSKGETKSGRKRTDKEALELVELPFVRTFVRCEEYKKALSTYLIGLRREAVETPYGWFVHPSFNLNTVISFRSSSSNPNFQNQPARNPEIAEMIRQCYIPRKGRHIGEIDYGQIEVGVPAAITGDAELRRYFTDPTTDMHTDQACAVFILPREEINRKTARSTTKNNFVFASFYGAAYQNCARRIWEDIDRFDIKTVSGVPMKKHLRKHGIKELGDYELNSNKKMGYYERNNNPPRPGTFVHHMKKCQDELWRRFNGYANWKEAVYQKYLREGGLTFVTGFAFNGIGPKNEVTNYPIQGPAFHCTLWSLIQIVNRLRQYKFKSKVIGEIHDSIQLDIVPSELNDVVDLCVEVMTKKLLDEWSWITVPLKTSVEISPVNKSWFSKKEWFKNSKGNWGLPMEHNSIK
jgi:DNA polymerase I-like protein with 3'-5' exonuclease and polymerase domains